MSPALRCSALLALTLALTACGGTKEQVTRNEFEATALGPAEINRKIAEYSRHYQVPEALVHRVVQRESGYNPAARNGTYYGLMQIAPQTARQMGFTGDPSGLLNADTNLKYAVKYLRGAWLVSDGSHDKALGWYSKGYYYEAKRRGLLNEAGLR